jgi:antitoxin component YwqK of YwqJK toxin-antitoxin module
MKKTTFIFLFASISIVCLHCNIKDEYRETSINKNGYLIKGRMNKDSVFDGEIQYFLNNKLVSIRNFSRGISNGESINYFSNGEIEQSSYDFHGVTNGVSQLFDTLGNLIQTKNYFYGRLMGPQVYYDSLSAPKRYEFLNFENDVILELEYRNNKIIGHTKDLVFTRFDTLIEDNITKLNLFCYLFDPPKLKLNYSLCIINSSDNKIISEVEKINKSKIFFNKSFNLLPPGKRYCVKLQVSDSIDHFNQVIISPFFSN